MKFVQDYKINLIEPAALTDDELKMFVTDFRQVMEFLKYSNDKQKMQELLREDSSYTEISTQAALVLNACSNIRIKINQNKEKTDMCKAIQEIKQEAVEEATVNLLLRTAKALMETLHLPAEQVLEAMKVSENEQKTLTPMLQL